MYGFAQFSIYVPEALLSKRSCKLRECLLNIRLCSSENRKVVLRLAVAALLLFLSYIVGAGVGRDNSPHYASAEEGVLYLLTNARVDRPAPASAVVRLQAGPDTYLYSWPAGRLTRRPATKEELNGSSDRWVIWEAYRLNRLDGHSPVEALNDLKSKVSGLRRVAGANARGESWLQVVTAVLGATVGIIGYANTYEDPRRYRDPEFVRGLVDSASWRLIAEQSVNCSEIRDELRHLQRQEAFGASAPRPRTELEVIEEAVRPDLIAQFKVEVKRCDQWASFFHETSPGQG